MCFEIIFLRIESSIIVYSILQKAWYCGCSWERAKRSIKSEKNPVILTRKEANIRCRSVCQQRIKLGWFFSWPIFVTKYERRNKHTWTGRKLVYCWIVSTLESRCNFGGYGIFKCDCQNWIIFCFEEDLLSMPFQFQKSFPLETNAHIWLSNVDSYFCLPWYGIQPQSSVSTTDTSLYSFLWIEWNRI